MIYPMAQSVARVCVEIDKKMLLQWHCPLTSSSSSKNKISLNYLNFEFVTHACHTNTSAWTVGAANNHCMPKRGPIVPAKV
jgi:hypothetical protein